MRRRVLVLLLMTLFIISAILGGCADVEIQTVTTTSKFPEKPIVTIVPFGVGGGMDLIARSLEKVSFRHLGQPLVIMNKPGGAGTIGWNELVRANPDGYTIGIVSIDVLLSPLLNASKYNYPTALEPLAQISSPPMVLCVKSDQPWQKIDDLIVYAKQHPNQLKFGHSGVGSFSHLVGEMFAQEANISIDQVPFSGASEVIAALLGGHVQLIINTPGVLKEHVKNGTIRILAVSGDQRSVEAELKQIPTFKEQGLDITLTNWYGIAAPKEMPVNVKRKLTEGFKAAITDPEFEKIMKNAGVTVKYLGPEEMQTKWLSDSQRLSETLKGSNVLELIKAHKK